MPKKLIITVATILFLFLISAFVYTKEPFLVEQLLLNKQVSVLTVSSTNSFLEEPVKVALAKNFFNKYGIDLRVKSYSAGSDALNGLTKGEVDLAFSSETPFLHSIINDNQIKSIATIVSANKHVNVIGLVQKDINEISDLKDKTIGITLGSNAEYYLQLVLEKNGLSIEDVILLDVEPAQMQQVIYNDRVDAVVTWNPIASSILNNSNIQSKRLDDDNAYTVYFQIATTDKLINQNPYAISNFLLALQEAYVYAQKNPIETKQILVSGTTMTFSDLENVEDIYNKNIGLSYDYEKTLSQELTWIKKYKNKEEAQIEISNYLDGSILKTTQQRFLWKILN